MISKKFYFNIIVRLSLLMISFITFLPFIKSQERLFTMVLIIALIILQVVSLLKYINRFNKEISNFFTALKTNDISFAFHEKSFRYITSKFRNDIDFLKKQLFNVRKQIEIQQSYFKTVIENAQTGILTINNEGNIDIINKSALKLLKLERASQISEFQSLYPEFYNFLRSASAGTENLINLNQQDTTIPLSLRVTEIKQLNNTFKIISFQNIQKELDQKELTAWQNLIRVLTHEINNTVSPIISLADSIEKQFPSFYELEKIDKELINNTHDGLKTISERGSGLVRFIDNYKSISTHKKIEKTHFKAAELFYNLEVLMKSKLQGKEINLVIDVKPIDLDILADKKYIEQIFINLIKNSIYAVSKNGNITLSAHKKDTNTVLKISDNGSGIPKEIEKQIFTPFFTTKEDGSGIGLSLAKQIIGLHGGSIFHKSTNNKTTFIIEL